MVLVVVSGAARGAQQCGEDGCRGGIFDPLRQALRDSRAARVFRAGPADCSPFRFA
jgi:hypothetical protein